MTRSSRSARRALRLCAWGLLAALAGCSFLANEFCTLDRAAPAPPPAAEVNDRP